MPIPHPDDVAVPVEPTDLAHFRELVAQGRRMREHAPPPDMATLRRLTLAFADGPLAHRVPADMALVPVDAGGVLCRWFVPAKATRAAPLLYFHGGGFVCGSIDAERGVAALLATVFGAPLLAVGYRQAPEHPFPAAPDDAWYAYSWLAAQTSEPITLVGDSAGGALAVGTAVRAAHETVGRPRAAIGTSAWFDLAMAGASWRTNREKDIVGYDAGLFFRRQYLGDDPAAYGPAIAPDLAHAPPLLVQMGAAEMALDDAAAFVARARAAGVPVRYEVYEGMPHNFVKYDRMVSAAAVHRMRDWEAALPPTPG